MSLGVPGLSASLFLREGVDLELELMLLGGLSLSCLPLAWWSPFIWPDLSPASSPPTSTTRSPSLLSPESLSCPDLRRSDSIFIFLAAISSLGVEERGGDLTDIPGDLGL